MCDLGGGSNGCCIGTTICLVLTYTSINDTNLDILAFLAALLNLIDLGDLVRLDGSSENISLSNRAIFVTKELALDLRPGNDLDWPDLLHSRNVSQHIIRYL